mgnify:CR=1 FL=1
MKELELVGRLLGEGYACPSGTFSVKHSLHNNQLVVKYSTIVHFASEQSLNEQVIRQKEAGIQRIDDVIANLKKDFRKSSNKTLKVEDQGTSDSVELISTSPQNPRKVAYFRCNRTVALTV